MRKALVSGLGFVLTVLAAFLEAELIPDAWLPYVLIFIGVCTSYGVFKVTNDPVDGRHELK